MTAVLSSGVYEELTTVNANERILTAGLPAMLTNPFTLLHRQSYLLKPQFCVFGLHVELCMIYPTYSLS